MRNRSAPLTTLIDYNRRHSWVLVQCAISPERSPRVAKEVLVTEPRAVATGSKHSTQVFLPGEIVDRRLNVASGRYRLMRFCNDSPMLRNRVNQMKLHQYS